jgi:hypothetical protein
LRQYRFLLVSLLFFVLAWVSNRLTSNWHYIVPVEPGLVAYTADFERNPDEWNLSEGRLKAFITQQQTLRLDVGDFNSLPFAEAQPHFADFDLRVQARTVAGPLNNAFGVIFRLNNKSNTAFADDDFYLFLISSDGYYRVVRSIDGLQKDLSTWIPSPLIHQGLDVTNYLRVVAKGDVFQFYINGSLVQLCIPDDPAAQSTYTFDGVCQGGTMRDSLVDVSIPNGQIGVAAQTFDESGVVVDFDNLVILGPA